jgi:hypothetical protein
VTGRRSVVGTTLALGLLRLISLRLPPKGKCEIMIKEPVKDFAHGLKGQVERDYVGIITTFVSADSTITESRRRYSR